jgi:glycerophosphoryl diester phosphodiesterase
VTVPSSAPRTGFPYLDEPRQRGAVLAMAHRGGALHPDVVGFENTLRAFRGAVGLGYRYLETDVQVTRDDVLVAFHDDALGRVTDREGRLRHLSYAEVSRARVGGTEPVPALTDVLDDLPETRLNIDLKTPAAVGPMIDLIEARGLHDRVCIGSFDERTIRRFRRACSRPVATSCGILSIALVRFVPLGRHWPAALHGAGQAYQVPVDRYGVPITTAAFVRRAHASGAQVHVWTVDDRRQMEDLLDLGVDGIITDRTDVLREVLVDRGLWEGDS